jgi:WD40 repeat protein
MIYRRLLVLVVIILAVLTTEVTARRPARHDLETHRAELIAQRDTLRSHKPNESKELTQRVSARAARNAGVEDPLDFEAEFRGHGDLLGYALSPDGQFIAAIPYERYTSIRIITVGDGRVVGEIDAFAWRTHSLALTPDGRYLIAGGDDGLVDFEYKIKMWSFPDGAPVSTFSQEHTDWIRALAVTPDGQQVVSASDDNSIKVWDIGTASLVRTINAHSDWVRDVVITPDGQRIISASDDFTVRATQITNGNLIWTYTGNDWIHDIAVTPDGSYIAVAEDASTSAFVLNASNGTLAYTLSGHPLNVSTVAFTEDSQRILTGAKDGSVYVWQLSDGSFSYVLENVHTYDIEWMVTGLGDDIVLTGSWGVISAIELATGDVITEMGLGNLMSAAVSPDGSYVVTGSADGRVRVWDRRTGQLIRTSREKHGDWVWAVAVSPDGQYIASAGDFLLDYTVKVFRADDLGLIQEFPHEQDERINSLAFSPDNQYLISGTDWPATIVWRVADGAIIYEFEDSVTDVVLIAVTSDGSGVASADGNGAIHVRSLVNGSLVSSMSQGEPLVGMSFGEIAGASASTIFSDDFESGATGWSDRGSGTWELGTPAVGPTSGHNSATTYGTELDGEYAVDSYYELWSPLIQLPTVGPGESIRLSYWEWYDVEEPLDENTYYDSAMVWLTPDEGESWWSLVKFAGFSGDWVRRSLDLTDYAGSAVNISFDLGTDGSIVKYGWYIDNVNVDVISPGQITEPAIFAADQSGAVNAWTVSHGSWARGWQLGDWADAFALAPEGESFIIADYEPVSSDKSDHLIELWSVADGTQTASFTTGHSDRLGELFLDESGRYVVTASKGDQTLRSHIVDPPFGESVTPSLSFEAVSGLPVRILIRGTYHGTGAANLSFNIDPANLIPDPSGLVVRSAFDGLPGFNITTSSVDGPITLNISSSGRVSLDNDVVAELAFVPAPGAQSGSTVPIAWNRQSTSIGGAAPTLQDGSYTIPLPRGTRISSFTPYSLPAGILNTVQIRGANFSGATTVSFVDASQVTTPAVTYVVVNDGLIQATVPTSLDAGMYRARVIAPIGDVTSSVSFELEAGALDANAPSVVANLRIDSTTTGAMLISWTAPSDLDASVQLVPVTAYDLRVSTGALDESNFGALQRVSLGTPAAPGQTESVWVAPLESGRLYFLAIQSVDAIGNRSAISDVVHGITRQDLDPPEVVRQAVTALSDHQMTVVVETDEATTAHMKLFQAFGGDADTVRVVATEGSRLHRLTAVGLSRNTFYGYTLNVTDLAGNGIGTAPRGAQTLSEPDDTWPAFTRQPYAAARSDNSLTIGWSASEPVTAVIWYGSSTTLSDSIIVTDAATNQIVDIEGLRALTSYRVIVSLYDLAGNGPVRSGNTVFNTLRQPDLFPPQFVSFPAVVAKDTSRVTLIWSADEPVTAVIEFGETESYGHALELKNSRTDHFAVLTNLQSNTRYHYRVRVSDDSKAETVSMDRVFRTTAGPDNEPPVVLESPVVVTGPSDARIQFRTDEPAITTVHYGSSQGALTRATAAFQLATKHELLISGLTSNTTYYYLLTTFDATGNAPVLRLRSFRTESSIDVESPIVVSGPVVAYAADDRIVMKWRTDELTTGEVWYQAEGDTVAASVAGGSLDWSHEVTLTNLNPASTYDFAIVATDVAGNSAITPEGTSIFSKVSPLPRITRRGDLARSSNPGRGGSFTTAATSDDTAPVVLTGPNVVGQTNATISVSWQTDEAATSLVRYREVVDGVPGKISVAEFDDQVERGDITQEHLVSITNLRPGTKYELQVSNTDPAGNSLDDTRTTVAVTLTGVDVTPPQIVHPPTIRATDTRAVIQWQTDEIADSEVVAWTTREEHKVTIGTRVIEHTVTLTNLTPDTEYFCVVRSADIGDNGPTEVRGLTFTTAASADVDAPAISGTGVRALSNNASKISWNTDEPADSYLEYGTTQALGFVVESGDRDSVHSLWMTNLEPSTTYHYQVTSRDMAGNQDESDPSTFTTLGAPESTPPSTPTGVIAIPGSQAVRVLWQGVGDQDLAGYTIYRSDGGGANQVVGTLVRSLAFTDVGLTNDQSYSYRVSAVDEFGNESPLSISSGDAIPATSSVPTPPTLDGPGAGVSASLRPIFTAQGAQPAAARPTSVLLYGFVIARDAALSDPLVTSHLVTEVSGGPTTWQPTIELVHGSTYYWGVTTHDGLFSGPASTSRSFTVDSAITVTSVTLKSLQADTVPGGVRLNWAVQATGEVISVAIHRAVDEEGPYELLVHDRPFESVYLDRSVNPGVTYWYRVDAELVGGSTRELGMISGTIAVPARFEVGYNSPNPFNPVTVIPYSIPLESVINVSIYDVTGRMVRKLVTDERQQPGWYRVVWDGHDGTGRSVGSGVYLYRVVRTAIAADGRVQGDRQVIVRRMSLVK